ncbi:MAG: tetratricopeptide repeat protein [Candidatus Aminicenantes bacterium]|nr:tetratricopeptide repeat protein [Candidatus Aminicenantes bacterium]
MKIKILSTIICILVISSFPFGKTYAQEFQIEKISDKVFLASIPVLGKQIVVQTEKGLVVFDSFWSETTAKEIKKEITKALNRDDFSYVLNMVDRLDYFGGNAAYKEAVIIGHDSFLERYKGKEKEVEAEIQELIETWRWKEGAAREKLQSLEKGSEKAIREQKWMNACKRRVDELESGYSLVLPTIFYNDRMTLSLGDITMQLIWFGKAGSRIGMTVAVIPEENLAIVTSFILNPLHLAPYPFWDYKVLDVPRWIAVLEEILEGEEAVEKIVCSDISAVLSRERAHSHLEYIRRLWNSVKTAEEAGKNINEIQDQLSLEKDFAFVKDMEVYKERGDDWLRPQHRGHVRLFFLLHKNLASEIIKKGGIQSLQASLANIRKLRDTKGDVYFDEASLNGIGYYLMNSGKIHEAIEVFKLNVEVFPKSFNAYDSLGEAYMKNGDKENAILNYRKSLELNPDNNNAREMLKRFEKK